MLHILFRGILEKNNFLRQISHRKLQKFGKRRPKRTNIARQEKGAC